MARVLVDGRSAYRLAALAFESKAVGDNNKNNRTRKTTRHDQHAVVLDAVKAKPSVAAEVRPALTASARAGRNYMRSGRKKASGGVEQKKGW
jgi:hypothetical protein